MGFSLLDRPNPNGPHYYSTRLEPLLAVVVHITAGAEDLDALDDISAENVAGYAGTTDRDVSWHTGSDTDSWVDLLPSSYTAWHATSYNSCTHGHEISKRTTDWRPMPTAWVDKTLRMAALGPDGRSGLRAIALRHKIPFRQATRAELDEQRANYRAGRPWRPVGFIAHAAVQPEDRLDPGLVGRVDTFPWTRFLALMTNGDDDDMSWSEYLKNDATGYAAPAYQWVTMTSLRAELALAAAERNEALSLEILAAVKDDADIDEIKERLEAKAFQGAKEGAERAVNLAVLPALERVLADKLDDDNAELAEDIAAAFRDLLIASVAPAQQSPSRTIGSEV